MIYGTSILTCCVFCFWELDRCNSASEPDTCIFMDSECGLECFLVEIWRCPPLLPIMTPRHSMGREQSRRTLPRKASRETLLCPRPTSRAMHYSTRRSRGHNVGACHPRSVVPCYKPSSRHHRRTGGTVLVCRAPGRERLSSLANLCAMISTWGHSTHHNSATGQTKPVLGLLDGQSLSS